MEKEAIEQTGVLPRSIMRTFDRFLRQLLPGTETYVLQEFRISRYQVLVSVQCLLVLFILPLVIQYLVKIFLLTPFIEFFWNTYQTEIFFNSFQQNQALLQVENFDNKVYFESLLNDNFFSVDYSIKEKYKEKILELAIQFNNQSIENITNIFSDFITFFTICFLFFKMESQIIILRSFITESIYSFSDTTKSFLLILLTDLLVGFHSPRGWEFFLELLFRHFGFSGNQDSMLLFIATFPVLLDTIFKYWIFRYLNKISPSTVATYHNMIE